MVTSVRTKFTADPIFFGEAGICGREATEQAGINYASVPGEIELLPLVVSGTPPGTTKVKLQFSHQVTKAVAKHHGATSSHFSTAPILSTRLGTEAAAWNTVPTTLLSVDEQLEQSLSRLHLLRSQPIGGLLGLITHWDESKGSFGTPIVRVLASPAMATIGAFDSTDRPGIDLTEVWDTNEPPFDVMPASEFSCPILASAGGFSRGLKEQTIDAILAGTAPLFIPSGEAVAGVVQSTDTILLRTFFMPTFAHLPIGMSWKLLPHSLTRGSQQLKRTQSHSLSPPFPTQMFRTNFQIWNQGPCRTPFRARQHSHPFPICDICTPGAS